MIIMQIKTFLLPVFAPERNEDELNKFLRSHRILHVDHHFCPDNGGYWTFLIEYMDGELESSPASRKEKKDPTEGMSEEEIKRFEQFKKIRYGISSQLAMPAYMIFTDKELGILARMPILNEQTISTAKGIQVNRIRDYAKYFFNISANGEEGGQPDVEDSGF